MFLLIFTFFGFCGLSCMYFQFCKTHNHNIRNRLVTFVVTMAFPCSASFLSDFSFASLSTSLMSLIEFPCKYRICRHGKSQNTWSQSTH